MAARKIDSWFPVVDVYRECERERELGSPVEILPGFRPLALARAVTLLSLSPGDAEEDELLSSLRPIVGEPWRDPVEVPNGGSPREVLVFGDGSIALEAVRTGRRVRLVAPDPATAGLFRAVSEWLLVAREEALGELESFLQGVGETLRSRLPGRLYGRRDRAYLWVPGVRAPDSADGPPMGRRGSVRAVVRRAGG